MDVCWIIDRDCLPADDGDIARIKDVGSTWSSWQTWRNWTTDNVMTYDFTAAQNLIKRGYHQRCNLYVRQDYFNQLGRPAQAKLYNGEFDTEFDRQEEVMCMLLAAANADILLLLGSNLKLPETTDAYQTHRNRNYLNAVKRVCLGYPEKQWVVVDSPEDLDKIYETVPNITCDKMANVLKLLT